MCKLCFKLSNFAGPGQGPYFQKSWVRVRVQKKQPGPKDPGPDPGKGPNILDRTYIRPIGTARSCTASIRLQINILIQPNRSQSAGCPYMNILHRRYGPYQITVNSYNHLNMHVNKILNLLF